MRIALPIGRDRHAAQETHDPWQFGDLQPPVEALSGPPIAPGVPGRCRIKVPAGTIAHSTKGEHGHAE
jgi:hypothetical protein